MKLLFVAHRWLLTVFLGVLLSQSVSAQAPSRWAAREADTMANFCGIAVGAGTGATATQRRIVAVGEQGTIVRSVDDGVTWARQVSGTDAWLTAVAYFDFGGEARRFFAVGERGTILSSLDGEAWTREIAPTTARLDAIGPGSIGGTVYAFGEPGAGWLVRDRNGTWTRHEAPFADRSMRAIAFGSVAGQGGAFYVQESVAADPAALPGWRRIAMPVETDLEAIAQGPASAVMGTLNSTPAPANSTVAVGAEGTILQRTAAGEWVLRGSGTRERLRGLTARFGGTVTILTNTLRFGLGEFFAVGTNGTLLRSGNGVTWHADLVPTQRNLNAIATASDAIIAVGDGGTILTLDGRVGPPAIVRQPTVGYDEEGRAFLETEAAGDGALSYLWVQLTNGAPRFVGNAGPRQILPTRPPLGIAAPAYQVIVGNAFGLTRSEPVVPHRLANLSTLAFAGSGDAAVVGGFSIGTFPGPPTGRVLIRAVGPGLRGFGVDTALATPKLSIFAGEQLIVSNERWHTAGNAAEIRATAQRSGAFPLEEDSADSAVLLELGTGNYTAVVEGASGAPGAVLLEVYDLMALNGHRLVNLSTRADVRPDRGVIGGLVIAGGERKAVLIRVAGPALRAFRMEAVLERPRFLVRSGADVIATGAAWGDATDPSALRSAASRVGAFPFEESSADAAALVELGPGAYTIEVGGVDGGSGLALLEIWELP